MSLPPGCSFRPSPTKHPASTSSSPTSRSCWAKSTLPDCRTAAAFAMRVASTGRPCKLSLQSEPYVPISDNSRRVDGYQECLHCQYTHPSFSIYYPPTFYTVKNSHNFSQHIADPKKPDDGLFLYFFPNCTLNVYGGGMSSFRVCPTADPHVTRMEFDYYHLADGEKFEEYFKFVRQVAMEDFELCEKAQDNLAKGVYHEGILNPEKENGVACEHLLLTPYCKILDTNVVQTTSSASSRWSASSTRPIAQPNRPLNPAGKTKPPLPWSRWKHRRKLVMAMMSLST